MKDKRIGLVPLLYDEYNYGGVLQFYALQQAIQKLELECDIIYYKNNEKVSFHSLPLMDKLKHSIKDILIKPQKNKDFAFYSQLTERNRKIDSFKDQHYVSTVSSKKVSYNDYKAIICGSDQIWNPKWARRRCFLEFVPDNITKVIYAASLGVEELSDKYKNIFKPLIDRIDYISVREYSAKDILDSFIKGKEIQVVADPTLLLSPEDWNKIVDDSDLPKEKYIFTYFLGDYSGNKEFIKHFAAKKELKIVNIPFASGERNDTENFGDIQLKDICPGSFISLIKHADYIFTDSFHACVFSTLFKREFYVFERDGKREMLDRIITLQKNFNLPDRIIPVGPITEQNTINYSQNELLQNRLRDDSLKFLTSAIGLN